MSPIANIIKTLIFGLSLTALVSLAGCDVAPDANLPTGTETVTAALNNDGGGGAWLWCNANGECTCEGDVDCNEMFKSGVCGGDSWCDTSNPSEPVCHCTQALRVGRPRVAATIGRTATLRLAR
jgi:hypothetical protein